MSTQMTPSPSKPQHVESPDWPKGALPSRWIDSLLTKFEVYYGDKFHRQWANVPRDAMRKQWAIDLGTLTREQIKVGVDDLKRLEWPPTLPEFIVLCCPPIDYSEALYEAIAQMHKREEGKDQWSDPAIYWAAVKIGSFDLRNLEHNELLKRFTAAMEKVLKQDSIEPVPVRHIALPAPGQTVANKERVKAEVSKIKALQRDQKANLAWEHRILEREKRDKVPYMVGQMARQALGMDRDAQYKEEEK